MEPTENENKIVVTVFPRGELARGKAVRVTHVQLREFLSNGSKATTKDELGGWSPAQYQRNHRKLEHLIEVHCAVLDIDNSLPRKKGEEEKRVPDAEVVTIGRMLEAVKDVDTFVYTSFRNKPEWPKFRVVMPLDRPLNGDEYPKFWAVFSGALKQQGITTDPQAKDGCRLWYLSSKSAPHFETRYQPGKPLVVDDYLALYVEPPRPVRVLNNTAPDSSNKIERARRYLAKCPPAVSGDGGHKRTWSVACSVVRGFDLNDAEAFAVMSGWNDTCDPPWSDKELIHKISQARTRAKSPEIGAFLQPHNRVSRLVLTPEEINVIKKARTTS